MKTIRFSPEALEDIRSAFDWYEQARDGLGSEFAIEVSHTIRRIQERPEAWPIVRGRIRRCRTHRFPYAVLYHPRGDEIAVVAVMHLHRHPDAWRRPR